MLLHGRGADEYDLHPLLDALDPERRLLGITPRAPLALPPGGAHWYRLGGIPTPEAETFWPSFNALAELVDGLPQPLVLGGFSQGTAMSWAVGLGRGPAKRPRTIVALLRIHSHGRGARDRRLGPGRLSGCDLARDSRPGDPGRLGTRRARPARRRGRGRRLPRVSAPAHDRPRGPPGGPRPIAGALDTK